jgi:hypothetical protein
MPYRTFADATVVFHFAVVIFVIAGAVLLLWRRWVAWVHLPTITWVIYAELFHRTCPLTYLENWCRDQAGGQAYQGGFVDHYIMPVLYPNGLTPGMQVAFGLAILVINVVLYTIAFRRRRESDTDAAAPPAMNAA